MAATTVTTTLLYLETLWLAAVASRRCRRRAVFCSQMRRSGNSLQTETQTISRSGEYTLSQDWRQPAQTHWLAVLLLNTEQVAALSPVERDEYDRWKVELVPTLLALMTRGKPYIEAILSEIVETERHAPRFYTCNAQALYARLLAPLSLQYGVDLDHLKRQLIK